MCFEWRKQVSAAIFVSIRIPNRTAQFEVWLYSSEVTVKWWRLFEIKMGPQPTNQNHYRNQSLSKTTCPRFLFLSIIRPWFVPFSLLRINSRSRVVCRVHLLWRSNSSKRHGIKFSNDKIYSANNNNNNNRRSNSFGVIYRAWIRICPLKLKFTSVASALNAWARCTAQYDEPCTMRHQHSQITVFAAKFQNISFFLEIDKMDLRVRHRIGDRRICVIILTWAIRCRIAGECKMHSSHLVRHRI